MDVGVSECVCTCRRACACVWVSVSLCAYVFWLMCVCNHACMDILYVHAPVQTVYKITCTCITLAPSPNGYPLQENKFKLAHRVYTRALGIVNDEHLYKDEEKAASAEVRNTLRLNLAAVLLKLDEGLEAKEHCVKVLTNDETNVKAFFRRGQVRRVDVVETHS